MRLEWLGQVPEPVDTPRWTRMEKLTAAGIALGVIGFIWQITQRSR